jgi:hypothetical protein
MWIHDDSVVQRSTNSHIAIKGHDSQEQTFCAPHYVEDIQLNYTPNIADGLFRASQVKQHLRDNACGVTHVQKGEVGEEEIHGAVEPGV